MASHAASMHDHRLRILYVSPVPPSPPRFGAQARIHGLISNLARRHDVTALCLADEEFDLEECRRALREYCTTAIVMPNPAGRGGAAKRALQLRSLASLESFERRRLDVPGLPKTLEALLRGQRFDVVNLEFPYLAHLRLRQSPPATPPPPLFIDAHEIAYDIVRQFARGGGVVRRLYASVNWRKLRAEELDAFRMADGVYLCSAADEQRLLAEVPQARTTV